MKNTSHRFVRVKTKRYLELTGAVLNAAAALIIGLAMALFLKDFHSIVAADEKFSRFNEETIKIAVVVLLVTAVIDFGLAAAVLAVRPKIQNSKYRPCYALLIFLLAVSLLSTLIYGLAYWPLAVCYILGSAFLITSLVLKAREES